jgi:hypothetical protein
MLSESGYVEWHQHNDGCQGRDWSRIHIKHSIENIYYTVFLNSVSFNEVSNFRRYYTNTKIKNAQQIWDKHFSLNNVLNFYEISTSVKQHLTVVWAKQMSNLQFTLESWGLLPYWLYTHTHTQVTVYWHIAFKKYCCNIQHMSVLPGPNEIQIS